MFAIRSLESFAATIGPDGAEFRQLLANAEVSPDNDGKYVTLSALETAMQGSAVARYLDIFQTDMVHLLHFDPLQDMPGKGAQTKKPAPATPIKRSCIAWSFGDQ